MAETTTVSVSDGKSVLSRLLNAIAIAKNMKEGVLDRT